jgi:hypothetical protein
VVGLAEAMCARLEYDLRYQKEGKQWELLAARGRKAPDWFTVNPQLMPGEDFFFQAFWDLNSDRNVGMSLGPIPWSSIQTYGLSKGLECDMIELLHVVIRSMDELFLRYMNEEQEKRSKAAASK